MKSTFLFLFCVLLFFETSFPFPAGIPEVHIKQVFSIADESLNAEHLL